MSQTTACVYSVPLVGARNMMAEELLSSHMEREDCYGKRGRQKGIVYEYLTRQRKLGSTFLAVAGLLSLGRRIIFCSARSTSCCKDVVLHMDFVQVTSS